MKHYYAGRASFSDADGESQANYDTGASRQSLIYYGAATLSPLLRLLYARTRRRAKTRWELLFTMTRYTYFRFAASALFGRHSTTPTARHCFSLVAGRHHQVGTGCLTSRQ